MKKLYMETFGCWLNKADSLIMKQILEEKGYTPVSSPDRADVILLNTCAVRADTERKIVRRLKELSRLVDKGKVLVVAGCLASARPGLVKSVAPKAKLLSPNMIEEVHKLIDEEEFMLRGIRRGKVLPRYEGGVRYVVPIASGCLGSCAYCIGKLGRGVLISYPEDLIVENIKYAVEHGAKEIYLTGQDAAAYGFDRGTNLVSLVKKILRRVEGSYKIRIGMMEPSLVMKIIDGLIELYEDERLYRYAHIPAQSGDDEVLKLIGRRYSVDEYVELIRFLRDRYPDITIATDIMVGLPGEDEEAFKRTLKLIEIIEPDKVHIARFTPRIGTEAMLMKDVPEPVKKRRSRELTALAHRIALRRNRKLVGSIRRALMTEQDHGKVLGRLDNYKLVILNAVHNVKIGEFILVKIVYASHTSLSGVLHNKLSIE